MKSFKCIQSMDDNLEAYNRQQMQKGGSSLTCMFDLQQLKNIVYA